MTRRRSARGGPPRRSALLLPALAFLFAAASCGKRPLVFPDAPVVVVSVDTLRADHLPAYGYGGVATPALDALARDAIVFDDAVAQVPLTLPSHVSLFTGLYPFENGVRDNLGYRLDPARPTLSAFLGARGYATGAAVSAIVLDHATGIGRGFDFYDDRIEGSEPGQALGQVQRAGGETEKRLEAWIEGLPPGKRFFAFLHLYEPHTPYAPPEPYRTRYAKAPYDGEIAAADEIVGRFLAFLQRRGVYDRALVVFLSDHGEGLGQHGEDEHGILLYRESIHVPLFLKLPGKRLAGTRVAAPAALCDVFPTVAAAIGAKDAPRSSGMSLLTLASRARPARDVYSETLYPRYHFGWSDLASLTDDRHQYIEAPRAELYDWREDPGETRDLAGALPPAFRRMRVALAGINRPLQAPGTADPDTVKKLASLGYLGQAAPAAGEKDLPDPKDRIGSLRVLRDANRLAEAHRDDEAIALLRRFVEENPRMLDGWESLARLYRRSGRPKDAIAALERADRLAPGTSPIVMGLADLHVEAGELDRARALAEAARALGATGVDEELAAIALAAGDAETARRHAEAARAANPDNRLPLLLLARADARQGRFDRALAGLDDALARERATAAPPIQGVHSLRGDVLAHLGRESEAEKEFRAEIAAFPENLDAWSRLALLYAAGGRGAEFRSLLEEMTTRLPTRRAYETAAKVCEIVGDAAGARHFRSKTGRTPA